MKKKVVFEKLFKTVEIALFISEERQQYESGLRNYRGWNSLVDISGEEGQNSVNLLTEILRSVFYLSIQIFYKNMASKKSSLYIFLNKKYLYIFFLNKKYY